jgi:ketosteroid isomerase-like protein
MQLKEQDLAAKVQWLVDIEEIKQLKARYAAACDNDYEADAIAALFTDDAVWDGGMMGYAKSREGIREFFANASSIVGFAVHGLSNPLIDVDGDVATGRWYLHQPMTVNDACFWFCARYEDEYVRTAQGWKFQHVKVIARAFTPYEEGFGKLLMAELPQQQ